MKKVALSSTFLIGLIILVGCFCGTTESYDDDWSSDIGKAGKADGLLQSATAITLEKTITGFAGEDSLMLFALEFRNGDEFSAVMTVMDGNLNPSITLYDASLESLHSESYKVDGKVLTKNYKAPATGKYYIAAEAYKKEGSGHFSLLVTCIAGPCKDGGAVIQPLEKEDAFRCVDDAWECAWKKLSDPSKPAFSKESATAVFQACLKEMTTNEDVSCATACDGNEENQVKLCNELVDDLVFYSKKDDKCKEFFSNCYDRCNEAGGDSARPEEWYETIAYSCTIGNYHSGCSSIAKDHELCGGSDYEENTWQECYDLCAASAWCDDLDTICDEECSDAIPDDPGECADYCVSSGNESCMGSCVEKCESKCDKNDEDCMYDCSQLGT